MAAKLKFLSSVEALLGFIFPEVCRACGVSINLSQNNQKSYSPKNSFFCGDCWEKIIRIKGPFCPICSAPFRSEMTMLHSPGHQCGDCREDPPYFSKAISPYPYEGVLAKAIQLLKYEKHSALSKTLVSLCMDELLQLEIDCVAAIPLHITRLREREFNQSLLLAKEVARCLNRPLIVNLMKRTRETQAQVGLSKNKRKKNIQGAFSVLSPECVVGQRIVLLDDVYTTGSTLKEGAKTLVRSGAKEVVVMAPARMVLGNA